MKILRSVSKPNFDGAITQTGMKMKMKKIWRDPEWRMENTMNKKLEWEEQYEADITVN